jgi:Mrp family chromosome partitioning ATPase
MSNIYEALEQACREKTSSCITPAPEFALQTEVARGISLDAEMAYLHHQVEFLLSNTANKLIQFMGSRRGEGVSTIVREFAKVAVERHGKSVLVLDSSYQDPARKININVTCEYGWMDLMEEGELIDKAFFRIGDSNLYFAPISIQASLVPPIKDLSMTVHLWNKLKEKFDLILIDSSSDANAAESLALCRNVDGVVLVLEAGKTRRKVVQDVKKKILANGGLILGVVLNKRRYYIPEALYKLL